MQICESTVFMHSEGWFYNKCLFLSLQSSGGSKTDESGQRFRCLVPPDVSRS